MKRIFFIFILIALIFITGCTASSRFTNREESRGGYADGLRIEFLSPKEDIREGYPFPIRLKLQNNADCDIQGDICVRDLAGAGLSGVPDSCKNFEMDKLDDVPNFPVSDDNVYEGLERDIDTEIIAEATYHCDININPKFCVRDDSEDSKNLCKDQETISGKFAGLKTAPVTVTKIEKDFDPYSGNLLFTIYMDEMDEKDGGIIGDYKNKNNEYGFPISVGYGSHGEMNCGNYLENGIYYWKKDTENIIKCEIQLFVSEVEENLLEIDMNYDYRITESKTINIEHIEKT